MMSPSPNNLMDLKDKARSSFSRVALRNTLFATIGLLSLSANAQEEPAQDSLATETPEPIEKVYSTVAPMSPEQRDAMNAILVSNMKQDVLSLIEESGDSYATYLDSLKTSAQSYVQRHGIKPAAMFVVNPLHVAVSQKLGLSPAAEIAKSFERRTGRALPQSMQDILKDNTIPFKNSLDEWITTMPAKNLLNTKEGINILIPAASYGSTYKFYTDSPHVNDVETLEGLSAQQTIDYINGHENWHYKDKMLNIVETIMTDNGGNFKKLDTKLKYGSTDMARTYNGEAFADIAALSDMIVNGAPIQVIDAIIDWRISKNHDIEHMSQAHLKQLKKTIEDTGLSAFRTLGEDQRMDITKKIIADNILTPRAVRKILKIAISEEKHGERGILPYRIEKFFNAHTKLALDFMKNYPEQKPAKFDIEALSDNEVNEANAGWNENLYDLFFDTALKIDGAITPVSLTKSYVKLQTELLEKIEKAETENDRKIEVQKLLSLQASYTDALTETDYVSVNADYGVNLANKEPAAFAKAGEQAAATSRTLDITPLLLRPPSP